MLHEGPLSGKMAQKQYGQLRQEAAAVKIQRTSADVLQKIISATDRMDRILKILSLETQSYSSQGNIAWMKKEGDKVSPGEVHVKLKRIKPQLRWSARRRISC